MATLASTLVQRTRRFLGDWPEQDHLTGDVAVSDTTLSVTGGIQFAKGWLIQIDNEAMYVTQTSTGTSVSVRRAVRGSIVGSHVSGTTILVRPHFLDVEVFDALNGGINAAFPFLYQPVVDESLLTDNSLTYEYAIPILNGAAIPYLSRVQFRVNSDLAFREYRNWTVLRGSAPILKLRRPLPAGTLRLYGYGPLPQLASFSDSLSAAFPTNAEDALTFYASQFLLASGEARRVREDTGALDAREAANKIGGSMSAAQAILQRFYQRLQQAQMPPLPKNVVPTI